MSPPRRHKAPFTARQVDELLKQEKVIEEMPRRIVRGGFAYLEAAVLVEEDRNIGLMLRTHVGVGSRMVSPNAALLWNNIRIRGLDEQVFHDNIPGEQPVEGWHEHLFHDVYGDRHIRAIAPPPEALRAFFRHAALIWNIKILRDPEPTFDDR